MKSFKLKDNSRHLVRNIRSLMISRVDDTVGVAISCLKICYINDLNDLHIDRDVLFLTGEDLMCRFESTNK